MFDNKFGNVTEDSKTIEVDTPLRIPVLSSDGFGLKFDEDKMKYSFFFDQFPNAIDGLVKCGMYGQKKYKVKETDGKTGWEHVENAESRYRDALLRHFFAYTRGEVVDPESKLPHIYHVVWNACALTELSK